MSGRKQKIFVLCNFDADGHRGVAWRAADRGRGCTGLKETPPIRFFTFLFKHGAGRRLAPCSQGTGSSRALQSSAEFGHFAGVSLGNPNNRKGQQWDEPCRGQTRVSYDFFFLAWGQGEAFHRGNISLLQLEISRERGSSPNGIGTGGFADRRGAESSPGRKPQGSSSLG